MVIPSNATVGPSNFNEVRSHSSWLFNERLAMLFLSLEQNSIDLNQTYSQAALFRTKSTLYQIWKCIRTLVRNNGKCRKSMLLDTKIAGVYTIDVAFDSIERMLLYCQSNNAFTFKRNYIMVQHLNAIEIILRDILQFFNYFLRPDYRQKPDLLEAAKNYRQYADKLTVQELEGIAGAKRLIDLEGITAGISDDDIDDGDADDIDPETLEGLPDAVEDVDDEEEVTE